MVFHLTWCLSNSYLTLITDIYLLNQLWVNGLVLLDIEQLINAPVQHEINNIKFYCKRYILELSLAPLTTIRVATKGNDAPLEVTVDVAPPKMLPLTFVAAYPPPTDSLETSFRKFYLICRERQYLNKTAKLCCRNKLTKKQNEIMRNQKCSLYFAFNLGESRIVRV